VARPTAVISNNPKVGFQWSVPKVFDRLELSNDTEQRTWKLPDARGTITVGVTADAVYSLVGYRAGQQWPLGTPQYVPMWTPTYTPTPTPTTTPTPTPTLAPTATPAPTATTPPTPIPVPNIQYFQLVGDGVTPGDTQSVPGKTITSYGVVAGSCVKLKWQVDGAVIVTLSGQPVEHSMVVPQAPSPPCLTANTSYILIAINGDPDKAAAQVKREYDLFVTITPPATPGPPCCVNGSQLKDGSGNLLTWDYSALATVPAGFRVYRSTVWGTRTPFEPKFETLDRTVKQWLDPDKPTCGKAYYVVALYKNVTGDMCSDPVMCETEASTTSWYSPPCP
jgi:hypothetical protein